MAEPTVSNYPFGAPLEDEEDLDAIEAKRKKKKKKSWLSRFLVGTGKVLLFIVLVIAVSAVIFLVFIDNAEAETYLTLQANNFVNWVVSFL